jgi:hypothetical protein
VSASPPISWTEDGEPRSLRWQSEAGTAPPKRIIVTDDRISADEACRLA